jgi:hypothetical protein
VLDSNSLYSESAPGAKDFAPFEMSYGQVMRFWGAQCLHYTQANETDITRVSFDFRVTPRSCHVDGTGHRRQFSLGCFFAALDAQGNLSCWGDKDHDHAAGGDQDDDDDMAKAEVDASSVVQGRVGSGAGAPS